MSKMPEGMNWRFSAGWYIQTLYKLYNEENGKVSYMYWRKKQIGRGANPDILPDFEQWRDDRIRTVAFWTTTGFGLVVVAIVFLVGFLLSLRPGVPLIRPGDGFPTPTLNAAELVTPTPRPKSVPASTPRPVSVAEAFAPMKGAYWEMPEEELTALRGAPIAARGGMVQYAVDAELPCTYVYKLPDGALAGAYCVWTAEAEAEAYLRAYRAQADGFTKKLGSPAGELVRRKDAAAEAKTDAQYAVLLQKGEARFYTRWDAQDGAVTLELYRDGNGLRMEARCVPFETQVNPGAYSAVWGKTEQEVDEMGWGHAPDDPAYGRAAGEIACEMFGIPAKLHYIYADEGCSGAIYDVASEDAWANYGDLCALREWFTKVYKKPVWGGMYNGTRQIDKVPATEEEVMRTSFRYRWYVGETEVLLTLSDGRLRLGYYQLKD